MSHLWRSFEYRWISKLDAIFLFFYFFLTHLCVTARRVMEIQYPLREPKPRDVRSKKVRWAPTVAEQSQIYIKRPRVSSALLTIIRSHDCRAGWSMKPQTKTGTRLSGASVFRARQTYRSSFNSSFLFIHITNSRTPTRTPHCRHIFPTFSSLNPRSEHKISAQFYPYDESYVPWYVRTNRIIRIVTLLL